MFSVDLTKPVVTHLVHEAVEERRGPLPVHPELSLLSVVVCLLDVLPLLSTATNTDHPQELVDVCLQHTHTDSVEKAEMCKYVHT